MNQTVRLDELTWEEAKQQIPQARAVVIPIGSVEQHGLHMPLSVDNDLGWAVAQGVAQRTNSLLLPIIPYGQVWSAKDFPGCINISSDTLCHLLVEVALSVHRFGAKNIIYISGHNGNEPVLRAAARDLYDHHGIERVWYFANPDFNRLSQPLQTTPMWNGTGMHAGEMETSMMMYVNPEHLHMDRARAEYPEVPVDLKSRNIPWIKYSQTGAFGDPTAATLEKGEALTKAMIDHIVHSIDLAIPR